jgi:Xaa-Pro aminopeptidase
MSAEQNTPLPAEAARPNQAFIPPAQLIEFMATGWIDRPSVARPHPQAQRFAQRRAALSQANRGTYVVVPAGLERVRANDTFFRFRTSSDFAYLVGNGEPGAVLVLEPDGARHRSLLFVLDHNRGTPEFFTDRQVGELWVGRHRGVAESRTYYEVDDCRSLQQLTGYLHELRDAKYPLRVMRGHDEEIDRVFERSDGDAELAEALSETRLIKDEYELAELRKACAITKVAFEDAARAKRMMSGI